MVLHHKNPSLSHSEKVCIFCWSIKFLNSSFPDSWGVHFFLGTSLSFSHHNNMLLWEKSSKPHLTAGGQLVDHIHLLSHYILRVFRKKKNTLKNQCDPKKGCVDHHPRVCLVEDGDVFGGINCCLGWDLLGDFLLVSCIHFLEPWDPSHRICDGFPDVDPTINSSTSGSLSSGRKAPGKSSGNSSGTWMGCGWILFQSTVPFLEIPKGKG